MKKLLLLLLFCLTLPLMAQENDSPILLKGKIHSSLDSLQLLNVRIFNYHTKKQTFSNHKGEFEILAQEKDILRITAQNYDTSEINVNSHHIKNNKLVVFLDQEVGLIEEVNYYALKLTGNLNIDAKLIQKEDQKISKVEQMGIDYFKGDPKRKIEKALPGGPLALLGGINVEAISDIISGRRKKMIRIQEMQAKEILSNNIIDYYTETYFISELNIPKNHLKNFLEFAIETSTITHFMKNENYLSVQNILNRRAIIFIKRLENQMLNKENTIQKPSIDKLLNGN